MPHSRTKLTFGEGHSVERQGPDMRPAVIPAVIATLLVAGALGRDLPDDVVREPHKAAGQGEASAFDFTHSSPVKDIWVTADKSDPGGTRPGRSQPPQSVRSRRAHPGLQARRRRAVFAPGQGPGVGGGRSARKLRTLLVPGLWSGWRASTFPSPANAGTRSIWDRPAS